jgi:heme exporter protein B
MKPYLALVMRDLRLSLLRGSEGMVTLFFFVVTASLFSIALGGGQEVVARAAPAILWVSAVLAALLSLETVYHRDAEDGTFDLLMLSPLSPMGIALAKMLSHWIVAGLALVIVSVVVSQMLFIPASALCTLMLSLLLGTIYMSLLGGMGAALTFGARRPGLLLALLILPLYVPMLILGVMALGAMEPKPYLLLQTALVAAALPLAAWVSALCLQMNMRSS